MSLNPVEIQASRLKQEILPGLWLDQGLALYLEKEKTLVVSDIHWGYAHVHRSQGNLLPMWGNQEIIKRLASLLDCYRPEKMIWLGDSIHGAAGRDAADAYLSSLPSALEIILIGGNHDHRWKRDLVPELRLGDYFFHHGDRKPEVPEACREIIGHWHPSFTHRDGAGLSLKLPVLVEEPSRLILPAFSPWSRGSDWKTKPGDRLWFVSPKRIWKKDFSGP